MYLQAEVVTIGADGEKVTSAGQEEKPKAERETKKVVTTFHPATLPGHTGYLTFATFPPSFAR